MIRKQSTEIKVRVGPFVDVGDAFTPETGVTLSGADEAELLNADGASTVDISGATWAAVTGADGWYELTLTTALTDTVGEVIVVVHDDSVCLPVYQKFQVVEENVYDALFAASAALGTDLASILTDTGTTLQAELDGIQADTEDIQTRLPAALVNSRMDATIDATGFEDAAVDKVLDEALSGHTSAGTLGKAVADIETDATAILADTGTDGVVLANDAITAAKIAADAIGASELAADAVTEIKDAVLGEQIADSVPADGTLPTIEQALYMITQFLHERSVSGTTVTVKKVDGSTALLTLTLDDGDSPTSITRAT